VEHALDGNLSHVDAEQPAERGSAGAVRPAADPDVDPPAGLKHVSAVERRRRFDATHVEPELPRSLLG
jgi:hypothetical protein